MTTHTSGPWQVKEWSSKDSDGAIEACGLQVVDQHGYRIDSCTVEGDGAQCEANVRLMAAAPELLAALEVVINDWTAQFERNGHLAPTWCKQARAAIARSNRSRAMTTNITARVENLAIGTLAAVALFALIAHAQTKDAADDRQIRAQVAKQAKQDAQPDTWAKLDQDAKRMTSYDRIGK